MGGCAHRRQYCQLIPRSFKFINFSADIVNINKSDDVAGNTVGDGGTPFPVILRRSQSYRLRRDAWVRGESRRGVAAMQFAAPPFPSSLFFPSFSSFARESRVAAQAAINNVSGYAAPGFPTPASAGGIVGRDATC